MPHPVPTRAAAPPSRVPTTTMPHHLRQGSPCALPPAPARSTEPHPESARLRGWLVLSQCLATPGRVGAPSRSLQAINCRSPRIAAYHRCRRCHRERMLPWTVPGVVSLAAIEVAAPVVGVPESVTDPVERAVWDQKRKPVLIHPCVQPGVLHDERRGGTIPVKQHDQRNVSGWTRVRHGQHRRLACAEGQTVEAAAPCLVRSAR